MGIQARVNLREGPEHVRALEVCFCVKVVGTPSEGKRQTLWINGLRQNTLLPQMLES